jgi:chemotaxis regulatin CheY-phosphate phosphatase CheZ
MSGTLATRPPDDQDYVAIEAAVMETDRGRWFLAEYARRNRHAETEGLLESLGRIERAVTHTRDTGDLDRFRLDVLEMSRAIARTRAEIAAIKPPESDGHILEASGELDSIVSATEQATSEILAAAERVQEVAWTLREAGADASACDQIDHNSVAIYTSCSFQDLTAQRTRKVIDILAFLETRVNAMADIWEFAGEEATEAAGRDARQPDAAQPPASFAAEPISQADVDFMLVEAELQKADIEIEMAGTGLTALPISAHAPLYEGDLIAVPAAVEPPAPAVASEKLDAPSLELPIEDIVATAPADVAFVEPAPALDPSVDDFLFESTQAPSPPGGRPQLQVVGAAATDAFAKAKTGKTLSPDEAAAALDALKAMSVEERTKLFS